MHHHKVQQGEGTGTDKPASPNKQNMHTPSYANIVRGTPASSPSSLTRLYFPSPPLTSSSPSPDDIRGQAPAMSPSSPAPPSGAARSGAAFGAIGQRPDGGDGVPASASPSSAAFPAPVIARQSPTARSDTASAGSRSSTASSTSSAVQHNAQTAFFGGPGRGDLVAREEEGAMSPLALPASALSTGGAGSSAVYSSPFADLVSGSGSRIKGQPSHQPAGDTPNRGPSSSYSTALKDSKNAGTFPSWLSPSPASSPFSSPARSFTTASSPTKSTRGGGGGGGGDSADISSVLLNTTCSPGTSFSTSPAFSKYGRGDTGTAPSSASTARTSIYSPSPLRKSAASAGRSGAEAGTSTVGAGVGVGVIGRPSSSTTAASSTYAVSPLRREGQGIDSLSAFFESSLPAALLDDDDDDDDDNDEDEEDREEREMCERHAARLREKQERLKKEERQRWGTSVFSELGRSMQTGAEKDRALLLGRGEGKAQLPAPIGTGRGTAFASSRQVYARDYGQHDQSEKRLQAPTRYLLVSGVESPMVRSGKSENIGKQVRVTFGEESGDEDEDENDRGDTQETEGGKERREMEKEAYYAEVIAAFKKHGDLRGLYARDLHHSHSVILAFYDKREAVRAAEAIPRDDCPAFGYARLRTEFVSRERLIEMAHGEFNSKILSVGEGELIVKVDSTKVPLIPLERYLKNFGEIEAFGPHPSEAGCYRLVYHDDRAASRAFLRVTKDNIRGVEIAWEDTKTLDQHLAKQPSALDKPASPVRPLLPDYPLHSATPAPPAAKAAYVPPAIRAGQQQSLHAQRANYPFPAESFSPAPLVEEDERASTPFLYPSSDDEERAEQRAEHHLPDGFTSATKYPPGLNPAHVQPFQKPFLHVPNDPAASSQRGSSIASGGTANAWGLIRDDPIPDVNLIRFDRIYSGEETRTSCILRNLPNRMTQLDLMTNLDEVVAREYDFIYLRFDFQSGSNCGFGFVNFSSMDALLRFWIARLGQMWDKDNSRKLVMGGFANIQGKRALMERFRNSSVMDQAEAFRPKIFYSEGPYQGLPEPFPPSNSAMRKAKSINSSSVHGLYGSKPKGGFRPVSL